MNVVQPVELEVAERLAVEAQRFENEWLLKWHGISHADGVTDVDDFQGGRIYYRGSKFGGQQQQAFWDAVHRYLTNKVRETFKEWHDATAVITVVFIQHQSGNYQTASASAEDGLVAVRFVPHARASEINDLLKEYDASFVGGPKAGGFYRVLIAKKPLPQDELTRIVGQIAQEKIVDFAAAVQ